MSLIKRVEIAGFRGILSPLELSFAKGNGLQSMIILARNGNGKSSVTDSWEWFHTGEIARLNREDAKHAAFPHRQSVATKGPSYVVVEPAVGGELKLIFNHKKVKTPTETGDVAAFRAKVPHPCHLRYDDLNRFVYKTKADQYDALAKLMGFEPQVNFQKSLNRVLRLFHESCDRQRDALGRCETELKTKLGSLDIMEATISEKLKPILVRNGFTATETLADALAALPILQERIKTDPRAQETANVGSLKRAAMAVIPPGDVKTDLISYATAIADFKAHERQVVDLMLIILYETGKTVIDNRIAAGQPADACPLCGQECEGNLLDHIAAELETLTELKADRDSLETSRKRILGLLPSIEETTAAFEAAIIEFKDVAESMKAIDTFTAALHFDEQVKTARSLLATTVEQLSVDTATSIGLIAEDLDTCRNEFLITRTTLVVAIDSRLEALKDNDQRTQLVADVTDVSDVLRLVGKALTEQGQLDRLTKVHADFTAIVNDFVSASNTDVEARFSEISEHVERYFSILEFHSSTLAKPALRLLTDHDRAVTLEIEFLGEMISPAYKYLSESQLNSFGLALFLASARRFNGSFKFLILDDIVNSFDGYKRPQVVQLLKTEFDDFQLLVLTHDDIWAERLFRAFPAWVRTKFTRFDPKIGPIKGDGLSDLEKVEEDLNDDEPVRAGQLLGPMLERELQELCECCQAPITYNRRNEYTLQPLMTCLRERVNGKLKATHPLTIAIKALEDEQIFRNFCSHWKEPATHLTCAEIQIVVDRWKAIVALMQCTHLKCSEYVKYDGKADFKCRCGALVLTKA